MSEELEEYLHDEIEALTKANMQLREGAEEQNQRIKHLIQLGMETSQYGLTKHRELWEKECEL